jgi:CDP-diacylglycerol--glycerol-3-phosphate 3-phosphatidyltransferase
MFRHVPNALTASRLLLALVFFSLLALYQYEGRGDPWLLNIAFLIYVVALVTDFLDGYLARKWKVEGAFGRIVDPFVDKILVLGTFIFFAGKNFIIPETVIAGVADDANVVRTITGVAPGVVVILLARELLVTSLRGDAESSGQAFGAVFAGKVKMGFQSGTILGILVYVNYHAWKWPHPYADIAFYVREFGIWGTVVITLYSSIQYLQNAVSLYRRGVNRPAA